MSMLLVGTSQLKTTKKQEQEQGEKMIGDPSIVPLLHCHCTCTCTEHEYHIRALRATRV
jgi:hypothetical protein